MRFCGIWLISYCITHVRAAIDVDAVSFARELINGASTATRETCRMTRNEPIELEIGVQGRTFSQGGYLMLRLVGGQTMVCGIDGSGISSWLELKLPDVFVPSVRLSNHVDPACLEAIHFYSVEDPSSFPRTVTRKAKEIVKVVPALLRLMESLHSVGLLVPWSDIDITPDEKFRFVSRSSSSSTSWISYVDSERSRKDDWFRLYQILMELWSVPDLPLWIETRGEFEKYVNNLGPTDVPDYDYWVSKFAHLEIVRVGDRFAALASDDHRGACALSQEDWTSWIDSVPRDRADIMWNALRGPSLVAMIPRTDKQLRCQQSLMVIVKRMIEKATENADAVDVTILMHEIFKDWESNKFCSTAWKYIRPIFGELFNGMHFGWVVCPAQYLSSRQNINERLGRDIGDLESRELLVTPESLAALLPVLQVTRRVEFVKQYAKDFLTLSSSLFRNSGIHVHELGSFVSGVVGFDEINRFCAIYMQISSGKMLENPLDIINLAAIYKQTLSAKQLENPLDIITLAWICDPPSTDDKLCALIEKLPEVRGGELLTKPVGSFETEGMQDVSLLAIREDIPPSCRAKAIQLTVGFATRMAGFFKEGETGRIPLHRLLTYLPSVEPLCRFDWFSSVNVPGFKTFAFAWMCGNRPEIVCSVLAANSNPFRAGDELARFLFPRNIFSKEELAEQLQESNLLQIPDLTENQRCRSDSVHYIVMVVAGAFYEVGGMDQFCTNNKQILRQIQDPVYETASRRACPDQADLFAKVARLEANRGYGRLEVHRETAFSDSLDLLSSQFVDSSKPSRVGFLQEDGLDQGGLTKDWFTVVGQLVSGNCIHDPAANLFRPVSPSDGTPHLVVNVDRVETPQDLKAWYAFGRLFALALIKEEQIAIDIPVYFFARFLNRRVELDDLRPELDDRVDNYEHLLAHSPKLYGVTEENPAGDSVVIDFEELEEDPDGTAVTYANKEAVISRVLATYSSGPDEPAFEQMRAGFSEFLDLEAVSEKMSPIEFKKLISGDDKLDVAKLKAAAHHSTAVSREQFNWLFEWLGNAEVETQRKFMHFVTGSRSFSIKEITVQGPNPEQGRIPMSHTCHNAIDLPTYNSYQELVVAIEEAVVSSGFGMA